MSHVVMMVMMMPVCAAVTALRSCRAAVHRLRILSPWNVGHDLRVGITLLSLCRLRQRHSGYQVGGTSPFGLRKPMPIYVQQSVLELERIYINGGRRGFLVSLAPSVLTGKLGATPVNCGIGTEAD